MNNPRIKNTDETVWHREGSYMLRLAMSAGWTGMRFASSVHVDAERNSRKLLMQIAINEDDTRRTEKLIQTSREISGTKAALNTIEHMRHALQDYPYMPDHIYKAVVFNAKRLTIAGIARFVNLAQEDTLPALHTVLIEYGLQVPPPCPQVHDYITQEAFPRLLINVEN